MRNRQVAGRPIVVLGMHRSGTSSVAGLLERCGIWLGRDEEMTGSNPENPKGFFERRDMRNICDALLFSADADWWKIAAFRTDNIPQKALSEQGAQFARLAAEMSMHGTWAVKEPRLCLLYPVLRPYLDDPLCVIVVRDPVEVAKSLRTRNGFSLFHGLALWENYVRSALAATRDGDRVVISYNRLVAEPHLEAEALVEVLRAQGVHGIAMTPETKNFISPELNRERRSENEAEAFLTLEQKRLWMAISAARNLPDGEENQLSERAELALQDFERQQAKVASMVSAKETKWEDERNNAAKIAAQELAGKLEETGKVTELQARLKARDRTILSLRRKLRQAREDPMKSLRRKYAVHLYRALARGISPFSSQSRDALFRAAAVRDPQRDDDGD